MSTAYIAFVGSEACSQAPGFLTVRRVRPVGVMLMRAYRPGQDCTNDLNNIKSINYCRRVRRTDALGVLALVIVVVLVIGALAFLVIRQSQRPAQGLGSPPGQGPGYRHDSSIVQYYQQPLPPQPLQAEQSKKKPSKPDPRHAPLPRCPKCNAAIAYKDERCPKCGHPLARPP